MRRVETWRDEDPDPATRAELDALLAEGDEAGLRDRFSGMLEFGTAGLRGLLGAGPNRMNRAVVLRATAGLARHLKASVEHANTRGVVVGFDGRRMSRELARDVAEVLAGHGVVAHVFEDFAPTPLVGFAVRHLGAAGGVVITASHNPPEYNGYKVYWANGAQIVPPHDAGIAAQIAAIETLTSIERLPYGDAKTRELVRVCPPEVTEAYLALVKGCAVHPEVPRTTKIAYTAMHGVGSPFVRRGLAEQGFEHVVEVAAQAKPDGNFPTVAFPNPEEKGAMDLVLALAEENGSDLVLANDPDADRLAVAVRHEGRYVTLTGNEIGCLFAHYLLEQGPAAPNRLVVASVVSSPMVIAIGHFHGAWSELTLTGHKWIQNRGLELEAREGVRFVFGYEEALGYAVSPAVRDKDGITAAIVMADLAAWCGHQGRTVVGELERMWRLYGMFLSEQVSIVRTGSEGAKAIRGAMTVARTKAPNAFGGVEVEAVQDFETGVRRAKDGTESKLSFPASDVVVFELAGGHRAMLRPSGTEPKVKFYFDVRVDVGDDESLDDARARGRVLLDAIVADFREAFEPA
ncbi:MAG: phospho-sugar mutase [Sandaracinus sp.]|nr:phospho-sugar mutase [Sandaracinus sp.]MCB9620919.1 phospho-sugar mutase [Sandaracinus sp.]